MTAPAAQLAPVAPAGLPPLTEGEDGWLERVELVTPAMCGPNSLFIGQLGDWTWDAVGTSCQVDPYTAVGGDGDPAYLSFAYFRVRASSGLCAEQLTFGDRLRIRSKVLSCGGDSVLTLHQVRLDDEIPGQDTAGRVACDEEEFFRYDTPGCIHVENFNRWIQRSGRGTNHGLRRAAPPASRCAIWTGLPTSTRPGGCARRRARRPASGPRTSRPRRRGWRCPTGWTPAAT